MRRLLVSVATLALCGCYESHEPFGLGDAVRPCIVGIWNCYPVGSYERDAHCGPGSTSLTMRPWADCALNGFDVLLPDGTIRFATALTSEDEGLLEVRPLNRRATSIEEQGRFDYWELDGHVVRITVGYGYTYLLPGTERELPASSCVGDRETDLGRALDRIEGGILRGTCDRVDTNLEALIFPLFDDEPARDATFHF